MMLNEIDPKLARATVNVLDVLISIEHEHRVRVLDAVTKLATLTAPTPLALGSVPRQKRPRCSKCNRVGHNSRSCPSGRHCGACGKGGHDRRNCPDVETPP